MTLDEFREAFESYRASAERDAIASKDAMRAPFDLLSLYRKLDDQERTMAGVVIGEWVESNDESVRYDARFLIAECQIVGATSSLRRRAVRLEGDTAVGARHELKAIGGLLQRLGVD
jgi:hypothetical protein